MVKTVNLGPEHDVALQRAVISVLYEMGVSFDAPEWTAGGSQEVVKRCGTLNGSAVSIEAETYIGLTVTCDDSTADEIVERTIQRLRQS